jgi:hypothetical protein
VGDNLLTMMADDLDLHAILITLECLHDLETLHNRNQSHKSNDISTVCRRSLPHLTARTLMCTGRPYLHRPYPTIHHTRQHRIILNFISNHSISFKATTYEITPSLLQADSCPAVRMHQHLLRDLDERILWHFNSTSGSSRIASSASFVTGEYIHRAFPLCGLHPSLNLGLQPLSQRPAYTGE